MSQPELVTVTIDGKEIRVPKGMNLVLAAAEAGIEIPVFCYHPKLEPAGLCRMCLVQIEKQPKPTPACTTTVTDGMVVHSGDSEQIAGLRKGVLEFLLLNHPLDCPVCDKGGECDLQDLTFGHGCGTSRLSLPKQHKPKAVNLGPFVVLDEERCILCRRCVRFDDEIAQEGSLIVQNRGHKNLITTFNDESYDHYFTGNVTELCPVGALTSNLYRFRARPWDLAKVDHICTGCSVGCNTQLDFRHGDLLRVVAGDNPAVDNGWLCDRGRFNYKYGQSEQRITQPLVKRNGQFVAVTWQEAFGEAVRRIKAIKEAHGGSAFGVLGGGRLTLEEAYALQRFARVVLGTNNVDHRVSGQVVSSLSQFAGRLSDLDAADAYLVVDTLVADQAPVADLRIRRGLGRRRAKLVTVGAVTPRYRNRTGRIATSPGKSAAVVEVLAGKKGATLPAGVSAQAIAEVSAILKGARQLAILWNGADAATGKAILELARSLHNPKDGKTVSVLIPGEQSGSRGAAAMGVLPGYLPGFKSVGVAKEAAAKQWGAKLPEAKGLDTAGMLAGAAAGSVKALYLAGANIALTWPDGQLARQALAAAELVIVQELFMTETAQAADIIFPAAPFAAKAGHYANLDGLVQEVAKVAMPAGGAAQPDGAIIRAMAQSLGNNWKGDKELVYEMKNLGAGIQVGSLLPGGPAELLDQPFAQVRTETEGDLTLVPVDRLYAGGGTLAFDEGMKEMANQAEALVHPADAERLGLKHGDSVRLSAGEAAIQVIVLLDPRTVAGTIQVPKQLPQAPVNSLAGATRVAVAKAAAEVMA